MSKKIKTVKGRYIYDSWDGFEAFECSECGAALAIVDDPVEEQPNFCFNCGVKFDWAWFYEALEEENPDNWLLLCNAGQQNQRRRRVSDETAISKRR